jgi:hypothetical protein
MPLFRYSLGVLWGGLSARGLLLAGPIRIRRDPGQD